MTQQTSTLYQLIEARLDVPLAEYVETGLSARKGWRRIAAEIDADTGCSVSFETLRGWFADRIEVRFKVSAPGPASSPTAAESATQAGRDAGPPVLGQRVAGRAVRAAKRR